MASIFHILHHTILKNLRPSDEISLVYELKTMTNKNQFLINQNPSSR